MTAHPQKYYIKKIMRKKLLRMTVVLHAEQLPNPGCNNEKILRFCSWRHATILRLSLTSCAHALRGARHSGEASHGDCSGFVPVLVLCAHRRHNTFRKKPSVLERFAALCPGDTLRCESASIVRVLLVAGCGNQTPGAHHARCALPELVLAEARPWIMLPASASTGCSAVAGSTLGLGCGGLLAALKL